MSNLHCEPLFEDASGCARELVYNPDLVYASSTVIGIELGDVNCQCPRGSMNYLHRSLSAERLLGYLARFQQQNVHNVFLFSDAREFVDSDSELMSDD